MIINCLIFRKLRERDKLERLDLVRALRHVRLLGRRVDHCPRWASLLGHHLVELGRLAVGRPVVVLVREVHLGVQGTGGLSELLVVRLSVLGEVQGLLRMRLVLLRQQTFAYFRVVDLVVLAILTHAAVHWLQVGQLLRSDPSVQLFQAGGLLQH